MKITTLLIIAASAMTLATTPEAQAGRFSITIGNSGYRHYDHGYRYRDYGYHSSRNYYPRYYSAPRYSGVHVSVQRRGYGYAPVRHVVYQKVDRRYSRHYDRKIRRLHLRYR